MDNENERSREKFDNLFVPEKAYKKLTSYKDTF